MAEIGDNSASFAREQLRSLVERIERIEAEIAEMNSDKRDIYAEAKGNGFDTRVLKKIIADRRKDEAERQEFEAVYDLYAQALGMLPEFEPEPKKLNDFSRAPARARADPAAPSEPAFVDQITVATVAASSPDYYKRLRKHCLAQTASECGGYGDVHCSRCLKIARETGAIA